MEDLKKVYVSEIVNFDLSRLSWSVIVEKE